jgi:hypothetical protein
MDAKCSCRYCNGHIAFDSAMAEQLVAYPHCGMETKLFVPDIPAIKPPKPPSAKDIRVEVKRGISPLGIAALVLGILSCLFCWIPLLGLLALPIAFIGLLLAIAGIVIASINKNTGFRFPISGGIVCILSAFIALVVTARFSNSSGAIEKWSKSLSVKQGDIVVAVEKVEISIGHIHLDAQEGRFIRDDDFFAVYLAITNTSSTQKADFQSWRAASFGLGNNSAQLADNNGNIYKLLNTTPTKENGDTYPENVSIYPQKEQDDVVFFELPVEKIEWLHLELPAGNFGGSGMLRIEIPMKRISDSREAVRNTQADLQIYLASKPYLTNADYVKVKAQVESLSSQVNDLQQKELAARRTYLGEMQTPDYYGYFGNATQKQARQTYLAGLKQQDDLIEKQYESQSRELHQLQDLQTKFENGAKENASVQMAMSNLAAAESNLEKTSH